MNRRIVLAAAVLLSAAGPAFAQDVPAPAAPTLQRQAERARDAKVDRHCLRDTGTHIRARASKAGTRGVCQSVLAGRVYTQEDLRSTGQIDIADALRMLDPSIR